MESAAAAINGVLTASTESEIPRSRPRFTSNRQPRCSIASAQDTRNRALDAARSNPLAESMRLLVAGGITKSLLRFRGPLLESLLAGGHDVHACAGEPD